MHFFYFHTVVTCYLKACNLYLNKMTFLLSFKLIPDELLIHSLSVTCVGDILKPSFDMPSIDMVDVTLHNHVSALIACTNKAIVRNKRNHMNNQTSGKCHASVTTSISKTKVSFVFRSTKDLQEIPSAN